MIHKRKLAKNFKLILNYIIYSYLIEKKYNNNRTSRQSNACTPRSNMYRVGGAGDYLITLARWESWLTNLRKHNQYQAWKFYRLFFVRLLPNILTCILEGNWKSKINAVIPKGSVPTPYLKHPSIYLASSLKSTKFRCTVLRPRSQNNHYILSLSTIT